MLLLVVFISGWFFSFFIFYLIHDVNIMCGVFVSESFVSQFSSQVRWVLLKLKHRADHCLPKVNYHLGKATIIIALLCRTLSYLFCRAP